jgi:hypothetical protein
MIASGMWIQAASILFIAVTRSFPPWVVGAVLLGFGTALVYPTLLAAIGDVANPSWRASVVGVYRLWRDSSYAVVAVLAGVASDLFGFMPAIVAVGILTAVSGLVVAVRMRETLPRGWGGQLLSYSGTNHRQAGGVWHDGIGQDVQAFRRENEFSETNLLSVASLTDAFPLPDASAPELCKHTDVGVLTLGKEKERRERGHALLLKFSFPTTNETNSWIRDWSIGQKMESVLENLQPEAAYFCPVDTARGGYLMVNMDDASQIVAVGEPFFMELGASVEIVPVMTGEDLRAGIQSIQ